MQVDEQNIGTFRQLINRWYIFFPVILGTNLALSIGFSAALESLLSTEEEWVRSYLLIPAIVISLVLAGGTTIFRGLLGDDEHTLVAFLLNAGVSIAMTLIVLVLLYSSPVRNQIKPAPTISATARASLDSTRISVMETRVDDIAETVAEMYLNLQRYGLTPQQQDRVEGAIDGKGYVTIADINALGLNANQREQVISTINDYGFFREEDVDIKLTQAANEEIVSQQRTKEASCFVTPRQGYPNIYLRTSPRIEQGNQVGYLKNGSQLEAIGHNGGTINADRWWLVRLPERANDEEQYGWVASDIVEEINEAACAVLQEYPSQ